MPLKKSKAPYKKRAYNRRRKYGKKPNLTKTIQNVMMKQLEKKRHDITYAAQDSTMGQVAGNATGYFALTVTPNPGQGSTAFTKIGNQISITSGYMTLQLRQMSAATLPVKVDVYLVQMKGDYINNAADAFITAFNPNEYIGAGSTVYDTQSSRNMDYIGMYKVLRKVTVYCKSDQVSGQNIQTIRNVPLKFKEPLKVKTSQGIVTQGDIFLWAVASNGNASPTVASTLSNCPVTAVNTGQFINFNIKWYYVDA